MPTRRTLIVSAVAVLGLAAVTSIVLAQAGGQREDCPGKITCPLTGDQVCRDLCPTVDPNRADCPGRITCPLTGELICKDRCPLDAAGAPADGRQTKPPPCCAKQS